MTTETAATLVWVAKSSGKARWYESECGRFSLSKGNRRGEWTLFDRQQIDPVCPQFNKMQTVYSLSHGKNVAARWFAGKSY